MAGRVHCLLLSALIVSVILTTLPDTMAFTQVSRLGPLTTTPYSAIVDTAGGFAYFGTFTLPHAVVLKVRLSDFTVANSLTLNPGAANGLAAVIDTARGFAYFATYPLDGVTNYATIVKVRLSDFTENATLNLNTGENSTGAAVIDTAGGFAYFGTGSFQRPGIIVKVRLSDFTENATMTLNSGEYDIESAVIDTVTGYAYFGTNTSPAHIVRVRLSDFTRQGTIQLTGGETNLYSAVIDSAGGFAYFGTNTGPGIIVKIRLSDFTRANSLTLNTGENYTDTAIIDTAGGYAYFGTGQEAPAIIVKVRLSDFTRAGALTLTSDEGHLRGAIIDSVGFAYFGTFQCCTGAIYIVRLQVASVPSAPQTLRAAGGSGNITLSWAAPSFNGDRNITGYKVYRGTSSGSESILASTGNGTSYQDSSVSGGSTYYYKITAINNIGESPASNEATASGGSSPANANQGNIFGLPPLAFYGLLAAVAAVVVALTILVLRRKTPSSQS